MGCHTWFSLPYITDKNEILQQAQENLNNTKNVWFSESEKKMYQYAIDNELVDPVCELAYPSYTNYDWLIYVDVEEYSLLKYNEEHGTNYKSKYEFFVERDKNKNLPELESYSDEPRIGGYPENIIRSYDEMVVFMKTGYTDENGKHFDFYYDDDRKENFMNEIKNFFNKHPKGIITFG